MKANPILLLLLLTLWLVVLSCKPRQESLLTAHSWRPDLESFKLSMLKQASDEEKEMIEAMWSALSPSVMSTTMTFHTDQSLVLSTPMGDVKGTWSLSEDGKTLRQSIDQQDISMEIRELSSDKLILHDKEKQIDMVWLPAKD